tara:strand:+ start:6667 stop:7737 length:1071 start_codon:yes stop_codon:yes gene_type:complete
MNNFYVGSKKIGENHPTYFIADIAANHDGDLNKAIDLIYSCAKAGANAAKFQHFSADTIVSDNGFRDLDKKYLSHQGKWKKSVFEVYKDASIDINWSLKLKQACNDAKIDFLSTPYSFYLADHLNKYVPAYKIGSGDINWIDFIAYVARKKKPVLLATGASTLNEVEETVKQIYKINKKLVLMQCNTNYTGNNENLKYINLNVLKTYKKKFPKILLGLSDHTFGHASVLGAISLGARVIEKHYTLNNSSSGPDHYFSMNPANWSDMINISRELESCLGLKTKKVEFNERETVIIQRRSAHAKININKNQKILKKDIEFLRPSPKKSFKPNELNKLVNKKSKKFIQKGKTIFYKDVF